jgi:LL-diaminopimelate aminotransferase
LEEAQRLKNLPAYVFAELDHLKAAERAKGADLIDLGMGNPDPPTPQPIVEAMIAALKTPTNHRYPAFDGLPEFREAVQKWCDRRYGVKITPDEVVPLIGSKEGLIHLAFAFINPGDVALVPSPAYPAHFNGTVLAGGVPAIMHTGPENNFIPNLEEIDPDIVSRAKIMFLSYPTNPTAATAPFEFFEKAVVFAKKHQLILVHDFAYAEIYFNNHRPHSILEVTGAKEIAVEFHTFSKTFSMAGWRAGFVVGNKEILASLARIKTNLDYGLFMATQRACIAALNLPDEYLEEVRNTYKRRRDIFSEGLFKLGWQFKKPQAAMYLWVPIPKNFTSSKEFAQEVLRRTGVVIAAGNAFGSSGEGFVRIALVDREERLQEAVERMEKAGIRY